MASRRENDTMSQVLRAARALIENPEKWIKGAEAQDAEGRRVTPNDVRAVCWCVTGAIERALGSDDEYRPMITAARVFADAVGARYAYVYNDRKDVTHADVMAAFDRAIAAAEDREAHG